VTRSGESPAFVATSHAAFREALDSGSLSPAQAQYAQNCLQAAERLVNLADDYI
jgi:hypothetical protein